MATLKGHGLVPKVSLELKNETLKTKMAVNQ